MPLEPVYFTRHMLADYLGVSLRSVDRWVAQGRLPKPRKVGSGQRGRVLFVREEVDDRLRDLPPADLREAS